MFYRDDGEPIPRIRSCHALDVCENALPTRVGHAMFDRLGRSAVTAHGALLPRRSRRQEVRPTLHHARAH